MTYGIQSSSSGASPGLPDLFGGNIAILSATLNGLSKRHDAVSSNIANATTPGYQKRSVDFEGELSDAIQKQDRQKQQALETAVAADNMFNQSRTQHLNVEANALNTGKDGDASLPSASLERLAFETRLDQNGVEIEGEMANLARNSQKYVAISRLAFKAFDGLKNVLKSTAN